MALKLIYVAGRFRAKTHWEVEQNIRKAEAFGLEIARVTGQFPVIPHTMTRFFDGAAPDEIWLQGDLLLLERCDALALVPGSWVGSVGTDGEIRHAVKHRKVIFEPEAETAEFKYAYGEILRKAGYAHHDYKLGQSQLGHIASFAKGGF